ncbi:MAG: hypothetical protein KDE27_08045 [Planctomycetes bacterium]|nr:hypothetical protein [Planctomycetota bacterium]
MASLELLIDAKGVASGSAEARRGLDDVIDKAYEAEDALGLLSQQTTVAGAGMREAFGASSGSVQVLSGLRSTADGLHQVTAGAGNLSATLLTFATAAPMIGRVAEDWRSLGRAMATTTTVTREVRRDMFGVATGFDEVLTKQRQAVSGFGVLWNVLRANPFTAIATAVGVVGTAIAVMGKKTDEAAESWGRLAQSMRQAEADLSVARLVGGPESPARAIQTRVQLDSLRSLSLENQPQNLSRVASVSGLSESQVFERIRAAGNQQAIAIASGQADRWGYDGPRLMRDVQVSISELQQLLVDQHQQFSQLESSARAREGQIAPTSPSLWRLSRADGGVGPPRPPWFAAPAQQTAADAGLFPLDVRRPGDPGFEQIRATAANWWSDRADSDRAQQRQQEEESMRRIAEYSRQIGDYLGDAAVDFAAGLRDGREIVGQILLDLARGGTREAVGALTKTIIQSFGSTR